MFKMKEVVLDIQKAIYKCSNRLIALILIIKMFHKIEGWMSKTISIRLIETMKESQIHSHYLKFSQDMVALMMIWDHRWVEDLLILKHQL